MKHVLVNINSTKRSDRPEIIRNTRNIKEISSGEEISTNSSESEDEDPELVSKLNDLFRFDRFPSTKIVKKRGRKKRHRPILRRIYRKI